MATDASVPAHLDRIRRPSTRARLTGLGSVFGKGILDSRRVILLAALGLGLLTIFSAAQLAQEFATPEARRLLQAQMAALPGVVKGLLGEPVDLSTLGGFLSWRVLPFYSLVLGTWSIAALSGTLAGETRRGRMELLLAVPQSRRSIATQKVLAHLAGLAIAVVVAALLTWLGTAALATTSGDAPDLAAVLGEFAWIGAIAVACGAVSFALAPVIGRNRSAGIAALVLMGGYLVNSYSAIAPALSALRPLSLSWWTSGQRPMAGAWDILPVIAVALLAVGLLAGGVWAFDRRDLGAAERGRETGRSSRLPRVGVGIGGPAIRAFADRAPVAAAWGLGMGVYGVFIALSADSLSELLSTQSGGMTDIVRRMYPGVDLGTAGGILQLAFFGFGSLMAGLAAATLVDGWVGDERDQRLELVLGTPVGRRRWAASSGIATLAAVALFAAIMGCSVGVASALVGDDPIWPMIGSAVLGLYAAALTGIGLAVGGAAGPRFAVIVVAVIAVGSYLVDTIGGSLGLPDAIRDLALTRHLGQPMSGSVDVVGVAACTALAVGGLAVGAWGLQRRDLER